MTYLKPITPNQFPNSLTQTQFIQSVLTGISGLPGELVRPKWQKEMPKQPDIDTNWLAFSESVLTPNANLFIGVQPDGKNITSRQSRLEVQLSFYGPRALEIYGIVADGFQIPQNLEALRFARMGFTEIGAGTRVPDLVNERWVNRLECTLVLQVEAQRTYPILTLIGATGTIHTTLVNGDNELDFKTKIP